MLKLFHEIIVSSVSSIESNDKVIAMHMSLSNNAFKGLEAHLWEKNQCLTDFLDLGENGYQTACT